MFRDPARVARRLLVAFAAAVAAAVLIRGLRVASGEDAAYVASSLALTPWIVGPAALAALLVVRAWSPMEALLFLAAEGALVGSTAWLWTTLLLNPDGQAGMAILVFPAYQFVALLAAFLAVRVFTAVVRREPPA